ncbi:putative E3 ubiquitin-protein ligase SINA-like 6 [Carex littledalei]|uniref:Putative E3 ubiquitin-protein ligase SINA-like 6 n=1 Tax=Carex littledalei TaxID=544730 RepID=A0A833V7M5_9POAL|nr:putative E3 ubiquitin-protein ligase SINA-like 6 [Carex littledalei]
MTKAGWRSGERLKDKEERLRILHLKEKSREERLLILLKKRLEEEKRLESRLIPTYWTAPFASIPCAPQLISHFIYGQSCNIKFNQGDPYFTLFGPDKELFLLVNEPVLNIGNALSLYCNALAHLRHNDFSYELMVDTVSGTNASSVHLKSQVVSIKEWKRGEVRGSFLLVPLGFSLSGEMKVQFSFYDETMCLSDLQLLLSLLLLLLR